VAAAVRHERPAARDWRAGVAAGALMFGLPYAALAWAELRISSGMAALLVATLPLWLVLIEWARSSRPSPRTLAGLAIGLVGVSVLVGGSLAVPSSIAPMLAIVGGELAWAVGSIYLQPRLPHPVALSAGMPLTAGGMVLLVAAALTGEVRGFDVRAVAPLSLLALGYLIVFGSIVAFSAYVFLLGRAPASRVSTHAYVNPLIAVALGVAVAGEPITTSMIVATIVIAAGVALVLSGKHAPHTARQPDARWQPMRPAVNER
jgi:drug/metabolite transporter (DMT)-like permease